MNTKLILPLLAVSLIAMGGSNALAQTSPSQPGTTNQPAAVDNDSAAPVTTDDSENPEESENPQDSEETTDADQALGEGEQEEEPADSEDTDGEDDYIDESDEEVDGFDSPISDLAGMSSDIEFVPLEEIEEGALEQIAALGLYPFIDVNGWFRVRSRYNSNFSMGTNGTSLSPVPVEADQPTGNPANPDADKLWTSDLRLRLEPTLHITESLRVHIEADLLRNVVLGSTPAYNNFGPTGYNPGQRLGSSSQMLLSDVLQINEAFGEIDTFFGTLAAGRMDNQWGLGMFANDGDCMDCDWGDNVDRIMFRTNVWNFYIMAALDFPSEGMFSYQGPLRSGRPTDLSQADDANQYTLSILHKPLTRQDRELQAQRLYVQRAPVLNGGLYFSYRGQNGETLLPSGSGLNANSPELFYRGMSLYTIDGWAQLLYEPSSDRYMRIELEAVALVGGVDNITDASATGGSSNPSTTNCFDESQRTNNLADCTAPGSASHDIRQFGIAMESEFGLGGPVKFGLNAGMATGGNAPNWGYGANTPDLAYYRFSPDYHVDLILFREVIGTVTNAVYANPHVTATFLEVGNRRLELQVDAIASRAFETNGAPGLKPWLGLEFDASLRFILGEQFLAAIDGGILFPFDGLAAVDGQPRLTTSSLQDFSAATSPSLAWTVQGRLVWGF